MVSMVPRPFIIGGVFHKVGVPASVSPIRHVFRTHFDITKIRVERGQHIGSKPNDGKLYGRMNENWEEILSVDTSRYIISGFPIWSGTGLTYNYPQISYVWNGAELTASQGSVTLDTADVSFDRFDLIVLSEDGTVSVIKGTASYNPIIPTLPNDKLLLLTINVKAGMTEPNIISEIIYNENSESPLS